jgi:predicted cupin superfamily sugar epimerase
MQQKIRFWLHIPAEEVLRYYQGSATQVSVIAEDGRRIQFPAHRLRPFITQQGVSGHFEMRLESDNRFAGMRRL